MDGACLANARGYIFDHGRKSVARIASGLNSLFLKLGKSPNPLIGVQNLASAVGKTISTKSEIGSTVQLVSRTFQMHVKSELNCPSAALSLLLRNCVSGQIISEH